jgi:predicted RNA methylase
MLAFAAPTADYQASLRMLKAISLYTGVGGLDFGFEAAGFETVAAVEMDSVACRTIKLNRRWEVLEGEIKDRGPPLPAFLEVLLLGLRRCRSP